MAGGDGEQRSPASLLPMVTGKRQRCTNDIKLILHVSVVADLQA